MTFNEAMQMLGSKLQGKYGHLGFKYKKIRQNAYEAQQKFHLYDCFFLIRWEHKG